MPRKLQLLTDNGSAYISKQTKALLKALDIEDCKTAVSSPQSNGMAESFVKTLKRDYWNLLKIGTVFRNEWDSKLLRGGTL